MLTEAFTPAQQRYFSASESMGLNTENPVISGGLPNCGAIKEGLRMDPPPCMEANG